MNTSLSVMISPFLPRIPEDFPRFRNTFNAAEDDPTGGEADFFIYTRMGGGNRECSQDVLGEDPDYQDKDGNCICGACDAEKIEELDNCIERYDDDFDCTYCTFCFTVPDEWKADHLALNEGRLSDLSEKYWETINSQYKGRDKIIEHVAQMREAINNQQSKDDNEKV